MEFISKLKKLVFKMNITSSTKTKKNYSVGGFYIKTGLRLYESNRLRWNEEIYYFVRAYGWVGNNFASWLR